MPRFPLRIFRLPTTRAARRRRVTTLMTALIVTLTFLLPFYLIYKPPNLLIRYFQHKWPDVLWHLPRASLPRGGSGGEKIIALTIDDAPSEHTSEILNVLQENDAKATFFVIGAQVRGREKVLQTLVGQGMELGNHAMHDEASRSLSPVTLVREVRQVEAYINSTYDGLDLSHPPRYFRPGSGFFSTRLRGLVHDLGYQMVLGSVYPHDAQIPYAGVNARHVLSMVRPGSIVICHDRRPWTAPMLRVVLPELRRRGFRVVSLSGLLEAAGRKEIPG
ncbi:glycoside hydrolase/deacetylase [Decorospora gaudefroyi]|uniref:chitin deacetylase n=1 Tax=Decorospora gaudefroyi TaxID=184978 RepID=A0A6A5KCL9_9PLEO|nr:glycoside hydrolase/deacetylase [Decorospora gaudefroyi]